MKKQKGLTLHVTHDMNTPSYLFHPLRRYCQMNSPVFKEIMKHSELREIIEHELFQSMKAFRHHDQMNCFSHSIEVAKITYKVAKRRKLDFLSATRAALLHDFYLYNWRTESPGLHGLRHPKVSLDNARNHFNLNKIEEDAILRHMFPITPVPPKFAESRLVSWADKRAAYHDYKRSINIRFHRLRQRFKPAAFKRRKQREAA